MFKRYHIDPKKSLTEKIHHSLLYGGLHHFFMGVIIIYALFVGIAGTPLADYKDVVFWIEDVFIFLFFLEIALKITVAPKDFFKHGWNLADSGILIITLFIPHAKTLRLLRFFMYLKVFFDHKIINRVIHTFLSSLPTLSVSSAVLGMFTFCYGLLTTNLFGEKFPEFFGHIGRSLYTLFQIMTLESWSAGVVRPIMDVYPWAWVVFVSFVLLTTYGLMNIFVGTIVNAMNFVDSSESEDPTVRDLQQQIEELKSLIIESKKSK